MNAMDSNVQPSFIPKKGLTQQPQRPKHHVSLFSIIATIIFVTVLVLAGVVFGVGKFIERSITQKQETLDEELAKFQGKLVSDLSILDTRFNVSSELLKNHFALSEFFDFLGKTTLKNVRFSSFSFNNEGQAPTVSLNGETINFAAVALQQIEFTTEKNGQYIKNVAIANPNLDASGNVSFSFVASLDPKKFSYPTVVKDKGVTIASSTPAAVVMPTATSTATTSRQTATTTRATSTNSTRR